MKNYDKFKELPIIENNWNTQDNYGSGVEYSKSGIIGRKSKYDGVHKVTTAYHFNGSGEDAFGGARQWPVISAKIGFQEGEEEKVLKFAKKLMAFIEKNTK